MYTRISTYIYNHIITLHLLTHIKYIHSVNMYHRHFKCPNPITQFECFQFFINQSKPISLSYFCSKNISEKNYKIFLFEALGPLY